VEERTQWILGIARTTQERKGLEAEKKAKKALQHLMERKAIFFNGSRIKSFEETYHFGPRDQSGIDFEVTLVRRDETEEKLPVQVKSYWNLEEQKSYGSAGICFVGIWPDETGTAAIDRVASAIANFLRVKNGIQKKTELAKRQKILELLIILQRFLLKKQEEERGRIERKKCKQCKKECYVATETETCPICGGKLRKIRAL